MGIATLLSRGQNGIEAPLITIETHTKKAGNGGSRFTIVGLPETVIKESKDRVSCAIACSMFDFRNLYITVNLAPADLPKAGGRFDLPIALSILAATDQIPRHALKGYEIAGELGLAGEIRPFSGVLPFVMKAKQSGRTLILPTQSAKEATLIEGVRILQANHLTEVTAHLNGMRALKETVREKPVAVSLGEHDLSDVRGQTAAKRALCVAAAGGHSLLMVGPPGTGKTLLASRIPTLTPALSMQEAEEIAAVYSISSEGFDPKKFAQRPFRNPHHTASSAAIVGGGSQPMPGEISLAHHGILFLDELPEFDRKVLEVLRGPIESGKINIARAKAKVTYPAEFQLVAAMNPCPCGYLTCPENVCRCTERQIKKYQAKLSGPLLDRIDMHIDVMRVPHETLMQTEPDFSMTSEIVQLQVEKARAAQIKRAGKTNNKLSIKEIEKHCRLSDSLNLLLGRAITQYKLSMRAYHRILKLARTLADLEESSSIEKAHLLEALSYRPQLKTR